MRWFVGDVHGCARELEDLLRAIRFDPAADELWAVGDLVNRGPDSAAAIRLFRDAGGRGVVGNHDLYALRCAEGRRRRDRDTLDGLLAAPDRGELLAFLAALPPLVLLPGGPARGICLVHAGLHPAWSDLPAVASRLATAAADPAPRRDPDLAFAVLARCCSDEGEMAEGTGPPGECPEGTAAWDTFYRGDRFVVHGHWARRGLHRTARVLGLDTACAWGGRLTAWCPEEDRLAQVPARA